MLTHAPLPPAGVRASPADFGDMHFNAPGIEAEIALRLGEGVTPERAAALTPETAAALVDAMTVSIEIVDSRWKDPAQASALLRLADQQSHGALVLGAWVPYAARDWAAQRCETRIGAREPVLRTGTHPLGDPAWLLPIWLRACHARRRDRAGGHRGHHRLLGRRAAGGARRDGGGRVSGHRPRRSQALKIRAAQPSSKLVMP